MTDVSTLLGHFKKDFGASIGGYGAELQKIDRVPTGIFPLDLATGGGFPRGRFSMVYGPESSAKTSVVLKAMGQHQIIWPHLTNIFCDVEDTFDPEWCRKLGADPDKIVVIKPDYAEQAVDMVQGLLEAEDCGIVAVDSLAALMGQNEAESSAEKATVGGVSLIVGRLVRRVVRAQQQASKAGRAPTFIAINQTRFKIGVVYGSPETTPGGNAPKFASSMTIRCHGKNVSDTKVSKSVPILKEVSITLQKWKCPIMSQHSQFKLVTFPHKGLSAGQVDDWNTLDAFLRHEGRLHKDEKGGWRLDGTHYATLSAIQERLVTEPAWGANVRATLIGSLLAKGKMPDL